MREGEVLASLHPQIVVKIPMIKAGLKAINYFANKGIKTNCTLVFSLGQAILAAKAGATYVSPFIGRLDDIGEKGIDIVKQIRHVYEIYSFQTQVLAASIRKSRTHHTMCSSWRRCYTLPSTYYGLAET